MAYGSTGPNTLKIMEILRKKGYNDIRLDLDGSGVIDGLPINQINLSQPALVVANDIHFRLTHLQRSRKRHETLKQRQEQVESLRSELDLPDTIDISTSSDKFIVSVTDIDDIAGVRELLSKLLPCCIA